jgi:hypothetical protein
MNPTNPPAAGLAPCRSGFSAGRRAGKPELRSQPFCHLIWPRAIDPKVGTSPHGPRRLPDARHPISAIAKSRRWHPCRFVTQGVKNGARLRIWRVAGAGRQLESTDVKSSSLAACDLGLPAQSMAKWRFGPSEKRHFPPFSAPFLPIFSRFFRELADPGANGRQCDSPKRGFGTTPHRGRPRCDRESFPIACPSRVPASLSPRAENRERGQKEARRVLAVAW